MKKFIYKSLFFSFLSGLILSIFLITMGGYIDYFYVKFTTPKAKSMIFGDSRSLQGIQPKIINKYFDKNEFELPMFNYSFTIAQISYDSLYLSSIKKKIDTTAKRGLFILSVHPWVLSERQKSLKNVPPHNMNCVTCNPNFEYFFKNLRYFHFRSIIRRTSKLHKDGWLEERNLPKDTNALKKGLLHQIKMYKGFSKKWKVSKKMLGTLEETINYLKKFGTVILVRMPVDDKIKEIENKYWKDFEQDIKKITNRTQVQYISFFRNKLKYKTYDGNHLDKYGGVPFTKDLCKRILLKK